MYADTYSSNDAGRDSCYASKERTKEMKQLTAPKPHGIPKLRILRQRKGLSLGQLATLTGIRRDTITHLENGREEAQPYHLRLLARVLEVPTFDLVS